MPKPSKKPATTTQPAPPSDIHQLNLLVAEAEDDDNNAAEGNAARTESTSSRNAIFYSARQDHGLISHKRQRLIDDTPPSSNWLRPYWLGCGLFLVLFPFWILDTLKDPVFGKLVDGNLEFHQPPAKLFSVCLTLCLVCFLEYLSNNAESTAAHHERQTSTPPITQNDEEEVLDPGGSWSRMRLQTTTIHRDSEHSHSSNSSNRVSGTIFVSIGVPYCIGFGIMAYLLQFNPNVAYMTPTTTTKSFGNDDDTSISTLLMDPSSPSSSSTSSTSTNRVMWHVLGYFFFAGIESFGSLLVATFWSFVNSSLSLEEAESYYGLIIAIAQLGAIAGSTMVSTYVWSNITLLVLVCLVIILHVLVMTSYDRRFDPTSHSSRIDADHTHRLTTRIRPQYTADARPQPEPMAASSPTLWSGLYLILKYNYVLLILGASCLYEVSLTCLNYQMTLLGWSRFQTTEHETGMNFTRFMGHYGQMVNISSLVLSSVIFPFILRRFGLRLTLRIFPTLLLVANLLAFGILPGNLTVLFISMSVLKALTYSIHDPSKEILYLLTSNSIKFKSKFWIDVVGARFAKAIGSSINTMSGSVDRSIRVASAPSLLTSMALWWVCYKVGTQFEQLIATNSIVGLEEEDPSKYALVSKEDQNDDDDDDDDVVDFETDDALFEDPTTPTTALDTFELASLRRAL